MSWSDALAMLGVLGFAWLFLTWGGRRARAYADAHEQRGEGNQQRAEFYARLLRSHLGISEEP